MEVNMLELTEDPIFKGKQNFHFQKDLDKLGQRLFGGKANGGVSFQIGQLRYIPVHTGTYWYCGTYLFLTCFECSRAGDCTVPLAIVVYIDGRWWAESP